MVAAGTGERRLRVRGAVAHLLAGDPVAAAAGQVAEVVVRAEAAVDDPDQPAEPPAGQVVLHLLDHGLVVGVPGPDPDPHRDPLAGDREPDHDLGQVGPVILRVPEHAEAGLAAFALFGLVPFEVGRGRVEEQQVDLEVQEVGAGEEHRLLHLRLGVGRREHVHRPVGLVLVHRLQTRDVHIGRGPLGRGQLRERPQRPVRDQREQHPLDVRPEPTLADPRGDRAADPEPPPERIQHPDPAQRPRRHDRQPLARNLPRRRRLPSGVAADRARQPPQPLQVELVLTAQVHQHLGPRHPTHTAVVRQLHVADRRPVLPHPLRAPQIHAHTIRPTPDTSTTSHQKPCAHTFETAQAPKRLNQAIQALKSSPKCPQTAEVGGGCRGLPARLATAKGNDPRVL